MDSQTLAQLMLLRRSLTSICLNLPIQINDMSIDSLIGLIDHFIQYPDDYTELANERRSQEE